jgi:hypothetical protein
MPAIGDRTMAGHTLTHIGGKPLSAPVALEGGGDFMRDAAAQGPNKSVWASGAGVITGIADRARLAGERHPGKDINFLHTAMAGTSGDFSRMQAEAWMNQLPGSNLSKTAINEFDAAARAKNPKWPGLENKEAILGHGPSRLLLAELGEKSEWMKKGFPDIASTRHAITEPALLGQPNYATGYAVGRLSPDAPIINNPVFPHQTYPVQLGGEGYVGGFEHLLPKEIAWPQSFHPGKLAASGKPLTESEAQYAFRMQPKDAPFQIADQEWVDRAMRYYEKARQRQ